MADPLTALRSENAALRAALAAAGVPAPPGAAAGSSSPAPPRAFEADHDLPPADVERYCRQMLLPSFGAQAQQRLRSATALIVGAGGLGCPAALYLAGAGVGRLIIADRDVVDVSNLHRQVAHTAATVGTPKTASLAAAVAALNPGVGVECVGEGVTAANAVALARRSTVVLDCVDNAAARYLLSDAAAAAGVPLVSGAALGTDGQVTVFGAGGPCRRCVFPTPPPPAACGSCAEGGVLGPVPGVIGVLQALEAIKVVGGVGDGLAGRLLVFDGLASTARVVRLRPPSPACPACGPSRSIDVAATDYAAFVGAPAHDGPPPRVALLGADDRVAPASLAARVEGGGGDVRVLDVRPAIQFALGRIPGSVNAPYGGGGAPFVDRARAALADSRSDATVVVVCRRGNDSQRAVVALREAGAVAGGAVDLEGGLEAWAAATAGFVRY